MQQEEGGKFKAGAMGYARTAHLDGCARLILSWFDQDGKWIDQKGS
jgi:hypothetical protein